MPKSENQKMKLLYILHFLKTRTDKDHPMSTQTLIQELEKVDICVERKTIYRDIETLQEYGYEIENRKSKENGGYYLAKNDFELPELKLLVDAVQASKFITLKKSRELIAKLGTLTNVWAAKQLERQVYVNNRIKTPNENIYHNVDMIHRAIQENVSITFCYYDWTLDGKLEARHGGEKYHISPLGLTFSDENYYMIGFDMKQRIVKHFRVDKMKEIETTTEKREGEESLPNFDIAAYCNKVFGMFSGEEESVTLRFPMSMAGVVVDRFGHEISLRKLDEQYFSTRVKVEVSGQFFGWVTGLGEKVSIIGPEEIRNRYRKYMQNILKQYEDQ